MNFKEAFNRFSDNWVNQVEISIDRNLHGFACDANFMGEALGSYITGKKGPSNVSGGMGFDLSNGTKADECKLACLIQPKECKTCKNRVMYFGDGCGNGECDIRYMDDSRFSINAKQAVLYREDIEYYILQVLKRGNADNHIIYEAFLVESKNPQFIEYTENQHYNSNSSSCNLLPYSYDFYRLSPVKVAEVSCIIGEKPELVFFNPDNKKPEVLDISVLTSKELQEYGEHIQGYQLPLRSKNLNKKRGDLNRKL